MKRTKTIFGSFLLVWGLFLAFSPTSEALNRYQQLYENEWRSCTEEARRYANALGGKSDCSVVWDELEHGDRRSPNGFSFTVQCQDKEFGTVYAPFYCTTNDAYYVNDETGARCWFLNSVYFQIPGIYSQSDTPERREIALDLLTEKYPGQTCELSKVWRFHKEIRITSKAPFPTPADLISLGRVEYEYQCDEEKYPTFVMCSFRYETPEKDTFNWMTLIENRDDCSIYDK